MSALPWMAINASCQLGAQLGPTVRALVLFNMLLSFILHGYPFAVSWGRIY